MSLSVSELSVGIPPQDTFKHTGCDVCVNQFVIGLPSVDYNLLDEAFFQDRLKLLDGVDKKTYKKSDDAILISAIGFSHLQLTIRKQGNNCALYLRLTINDASFCSTVGCILNALKYAIMATHPQYLNNVPLSPFYLINGHTQPIMDAGLIGAAQFLDSCISDVFTKSGYPITV